LPFFPLVTRLWRDALFELDFFPEAISGFASDANSANAIMNTHFRCIVTPQFDAAAFSRFSFMGLRQAYISSGAAIKFTPQLFKPSKN
jgi:hypothetical protein